MAHTRIRPATATRLRAALDDPATVARYHTKVIAVEPYQCLFWTGALSGRGHGRFWLAAEGDTRDYVVIAHRFDYGLTHGFEALMSVDEIAHRCDNTLCQKPTHWQASTRAQNRAEWAARRHQLTGPLRDMRGARGRALAIRDAVREGQPLDEVLAIGVRSGERDQLALWD